MRTDAEKEEVRPRPVLFAWLEINHACIPPLQADSCVALNDYERVYGDAGNEPTSRVSAPTVVACAMPSVHVPWSRFARVCRSSSCRHKLRY